MDFADQLFRVALLAIGLFYSTLHTSSPAYAAELSEAVMQAAAEHGVCTFHG
jgi:hypothetical protein